MSAHTIRLLVVDDDARIRAAIARTIMLEADLVLVAAARDAPGALSMAAAWHPEVVLLDVMLPDRATGLGLIRGLVRSPGCAVVAMSVRGALRGAALAAGAVAFIEKSDVDALLTQVRSAAATGGLRHCAGVSPAV
jgi:two-component system KDP operon response regulator KdpE